MVCSLPGSEDWLIFRHGDDVERNLPFKAGDPSSVTIGLFDGGKISLTDIDINHQATWANKSTTHAEHSQMIERCIEQLKHQGGKVVIARVISGQIEGNPIERINRLFAKFPETFRFIFYTTSTGLWAGCTPELLLENDQLSGELRTMALAGTRPFESEASNGKWDEKNIEEHEMVVEFIDKILEEKNLSPINGKQTSMRYGFVTHLLTPIRAKASDNPLEVITLLNPTPALSGYPRNKALAMISQLESQPRGCYGGYISFETSPGRRIAYVNLRSVRFKYESGKWLYNIFVGGGITAKSEPESEWIETELKSKMLKETLERSEI